MNSTSAAYSRPLVPEDIRPANVIPHAAWAAVSAAGRNTNAADLCARIFPRDVLAHRLLTRASVSGATISTPAWAGLLVTQQVTGWLGSLAPASAAASLIAQGVQVPISNAIPISIPVWAALPAAAPWLDESGAIPLRAGSFSTVELNPKKLGIITVLSKELARTASAQPIFEALLREQAALSLDAAYFSDDDGSVSGTHAGLLDGLVAGTGSAVMADDLAALAAAVGTGGSGRVVFVMAPGRAAAAAVRTLEATATILPSLAVPEDRVIAIDPAALVSGFGPDPEIESSEEVVLHMDSAPGIISTPGVPPVVAAPVQSMFQTAQIAFRMLLDVAFTVRRPGAVAYLDGATW